MLCAPCFRPVDRIGPCRCSSPGGLWKPIPAALRSPSSSLLTTSMTIPSLGTGQTAEATYPLSLQPRLTSVLVVQEDLAHFPRLSQKKCTYHCDQCVCVQPGRRIAPNKGVLLKHGARLLALSGRHGRALPTDHGP